MRGANAAPGVAGGAELERANRNLARRYGLKDDVKGMIVTDVRPESPAARAGLAPGDVIRELNEEVRLRIERNGREREIVVRP